MMSSDRGVRNAILLFVNACNDYQTRYLALATAFRAPEKYPAKRAISSWRTVRAMQSS